MSRGDGVHIDDNDLKRTLRIMERDFFDDVLKPAAEYADTRIGVYATSRRMRKAPIGRRKRKSGPLRIQTSRLARSVLGGRFAGVREGIRNLIRETATRLKLVKGTNTPYAAAHEHGYKDESQQVRAHNRTRAGKTFLVKKHVRSMTIPRRAFLKPSLRAEKRNIFDHTVSLVQRHVDKAVKA